MKNYIKKFSEDLFATLKPQEQLGLFLHSEDSTFIRFSQSKVRQNTSVHQHEVTLQFNKEQRTLKMRFNLTLDLAHDMQSATHLIEDARKQLMQMDPHPQFIAFKNNGQSETFKKVDRPADSEIPGLIYDTYKDTDLAGFWCSGPLRQASINSEGQFHFFETDYFFLDYSLYNGPKAAKGYYSAETFSMAEFEAQAQATKNKLNLLNRPTQTIPRGLHNVYLEPMAMAEIVGTLSYQSLSQGAFNKGYAPLKKLKDKELKLSPLFSLTENFDLGYSPLFNSMGELSPNKIELIKNGELKSMLTSTTTAKEYNIETNFADISEMPRSLEVRAGTLENKDILSKLGQGLYLSNLHYINYSDVQTARMTGMTRFACFYVDKGEIVGPIQDLRFDESIYNVFGDNLIELTKESSVYVSTMTYLKRDLGAFKTPGALIKNFNFTL
ncbi:Zn-dependent protease [Bdellovibrio sp. qaytius]|nr:Zn-dependent protease [Bdellovibrio sp. qaytius]